MNNVAKHSKQPTTAELRKNAVQMFYELGYDELGKKLTEKLINKILSAGTDDNPDLAEKEISSIMATARNRVFDSPVKNFAYRYARNGEPEIMDLA